MVTAIEKLAKESKETADALYQMSPEELAAKLEAAELDSLKFDSLAGLDAAMAALDTDGDGEISKEEMKLGLQGRHPNLTVV